VDEHGAERGWLSTDADGPSLALWTGERGAPTESATLAAGKDGGVLVTGGDERITLRLAEEPGTGLQLEGKTASAMLLIKKDGAGVVLENDPDEETFSIVNVFATERGAYLGGSWNDAHDFDLFAEHDASRLSLSQPDASTSDDDEDDAPDAELRCGENAGSLTLRHEGQSTFHAPQ
jgi:hypothetical protein